VEKKELEEQKRINDELLREYKDVVGIEYISSGENGGTSISAIITKLKRENDDIRAEIEEVGAEQKEVIRVIADGVNQLAVNKKTESVKLKFKYVKNNYTMKLGRGDGASAKKPLLKRLFGKKVGGKRRTRRRTRR
jgi:hypothetical protein